MPDNSFTTLGNTTKQKRKHWEEHLIALGFVCTNKGTEGQFVKLTANAGEVAPVAAYTDDVIGQIIAGCNETDGTGSVTIETQFQSVNFGFAAGAIAIGDRLATNGPNVDNAGFQTYRTAVAGDTIVGIALTDADDEAGVMLGVYRVYRTNSTTPGDFAQAAAVADSAYPAITAIPGVFADLAAARSAVDTLRTDVVAALNHIQGKVNAELAALRAANIQDT